MELSIKQVIEIIISCVGILVSTLAIYSNRGNIYNIACKRKYQNRKTIFIYEKEQFHKKYFFRGENLSKAKKMVAK